MNQRVTDELEALESICGASFKRLGQTSVAFTLKACEIEIDLPVGYPVDAPPIARTRNRDRQSALNDFITKSWAGQEALFDIFQWLEEDVQELATTEPEDNASAQMLAVIVFLDHMRDRKLYENSLSIFSASTGVSCRVIHRSDRCSPDDRSSGQTLRRVGGVDSREVVVVLCGPSTSVPDFLKRLRTEKVDVDSKGKSCLERKAAVVAEVSWPRAPIPQSFGVMVSPPNLVKVWQAVTSELEIPDLELPAELRCGEQAEAESLVGPGDYSVRVQPNCSSSSVAQLPDGSLAVRLQSPPIDGKANKELIEILADHFHVPKGLVTITQGAAQEIKLCES